MAYWTSIEPKVVTVWPTRNTATFFFQPNNSGLSMAVLGSLEDIQKS
jgi:hypothetical protein